MNSWQGRMLAIAMAVRIRLFALAWALPSLAGASPKATLDFLFRIQNYNEAAVAPDGRNVAWIEARPNGDRTPSNNAEIFVADTAGRRPKRLTQDGRICQESGLAWSPDSKTLAFLSDRDVRHQLQLYLAPSDGRPIRRVTKLTGLVENPKWSPDGRVIALINIAESLTPAGAVEAATRDSGEVAEHNDEARLVLIDVSSGSARVVSPADTYIYEYDWAPDGRHIAVISAVGSGDNNWWLARLGALDVTSGALSEIYRPQAQIAVPRWSPDGSQIAFIQGLMSDAGSTGGDIWSVPAQGGPAHNLTAGRKASPAWLYWQKATGRLLFTEFSGGGCGIGELDPRTGETSQLWKADAYVDTGHNSEILSLSVADDGTTSVLECKTFDRPPELFLGPVGRWTALTHANQAFRPIWGRAESIQWTSDGTDVQGWLLYPRDFNPGKRYPLVVNIHGGPAAIAAPSWTGFLTTSLAAEGYFVFEPNPRGSYGQGEAFTKANVRDFGHGDLRDILAGLDAVLARAPIDRRRVGLAGASYGGFMTMWALTQTQRFAAAVAAAGIADWQSYYGENQIDEWMIPYFGASVYDDPAIYARSSPITFIKAVRTPTLIIVGDSDKECPAPQSYEYWHALRALGIETKLVVYPNEGHWFRNPADFDDRQVRIVAWFDAHLR
ncbi:MAG TPA: S9 family peptidase [Opitutaceae bacterium]